jgi:hypothetical protein
MICTGIDGTRDTDPWPNPIRLHLSNKTCTILDWSRCTALLGVK